MPKISFIKAQLKTIEVPDGSNLMKVLDEAGIPVASSCGGQGVCTKCLVKVLEGKENLSRESDLEHDMRDIHEFEKAQRMSCQTTIQGNIKIDTEYW